MKVIIFTVTLKRNIKNKKIKYVMLLYYKALRHHGNYIMVI